MFGLVPFAGASFSDLGVSPDVTLALTGNAATGSVGFSNLVGNNADIPNTYWSGSSYPAWRSIGVGPTSLSVNPDTMNDAAKYNGYVYVLENPQIKDKDYSLKMTFRYSWGRA